jgi:hypothetical protein
MEYGYARVSTDDQKADLQIAALKKAGCRHVFTDTASGASGKRPELTRCLASGRGMCWWCGSSTGWGGRCRIWGVFAQTDKNSHRNLSVFAAGPETLFTVGRGSFRA